MKKVLLITNIPNPYRVPLFNELNSQLTQQHFSLKIIFAGSTYKRRLFKLSTGDFKFDYKILGGENFSPANNSEKTYFLYKGLWKLLKQEKPDQIIVSGFSIATMIVFLYHKLTSTPYLIWTGSVEKENRNDGFFRKIQRKILLQAAKAFVVYGSKAKEYLINNHVSPQKIHIAINTVDTDFFFHSTNELRKKTKISSPPVFLYLGYLVPRKNVKQLLLAIEKLSIIRRDFRLEIIGDGTSKAELEEFVSRKKLQDLVSFEGFKQKEELPSYFSRSTALLFQTDFDIWGLVLNEAMAAGLPCLASVNAGAVNDLIIEKENGFIINFDDIDAVAQKINWMIDYPEEIKQIGERSAEFIRTKANLKIAAEGFVNALQSSAT